MTLVHKTELVASALRMFGLSGLDMIATSRWYRMVAWNDAFWIKVIKRFPRAK